MRKFYVFLVIVFIMVLCPVIVGFIVSIPSVNFLPVRDNDWIGFWGDYIGSFIGAGIGGVIAYLIAKYQFDKQREANQKEVQKQRNLEHLSKLKIETIKLRQLVTNHHLHINSVYRFITETYTSLDNKKTFTDAFRSQYETYHSDISENTKLIHDAIANFELQYEINSPSISTIISKEQSIQDALHVVHQGAAIINEVEKILRKKVWVKDEHQQDTRIEQIIVYNKEFQNLHQVAAYNYYVTTSKIGNKINNELELPKVSIMPEQEFRKHNGY